MISRAIAMDSMNESNQLLLELNANETPKALVVLSVPERLQIEMIRVNGQLRLEWLGSGSLQKADQIDGPWAASANQERTQIVSPLASGKFFRISP